MKKRNLDLKKLSLKKENITALRQQAQDHAIGGADSDYCPSGRYVACNYTMQQSCVYCATINGNTCRPDMCGLAPSALSCMAGHGCASANLDCSGGTLCAVPNK